MVPSATPPQFDSVGEWVTKIPNSVAASTSRERALALNILENRPFEIDARTYFDNDYAYAKDVAKCIELAWKTSNPQQRAYNCSNGTVTTAEDIRRTVKELFDIDVKVVGQNGPQRNAFSLDLTASREQLGFVPEYPFKEALRDYVVEMRRDPV